MAVLTALVLWTLAYTSPCIPERDPHSVERNMPLERFACPEGHVSEGATVFYSSLDRTVKHMFHSLHPFSMQTCLLLVSTFSPAWGSRVG